MNRDFKRIDDVLNSLLYGSGDAPEVRELLRLTSFMDSSLRRWDLKRKLDHYVTLKQPAAKKKQWEQIHDVLAGFSSEVSMERTRTDRGGSTVQ